MNNNPNALPSYNIADVDTEIGFYKTLFHLHDKGLMSCLPAIIEKYDRATHIADVKPLVKATMRLEGKEVPFDRPTYRVPVQQMCHGGFNIDAPLFVGDTGLLFAIDREWITARKQNSAELKEPQDPEKGEENPNKGAVVPDSYGLASFEYGFFLPCSWAKTDLKDEDGFVVRLPVKDGEVIIRIDKDGTTTFGGDVVFNNPVTFKGKINGTEAEFSGLVKAKDLKTKDCEILELDVVTDAKTEDGVTTLKINRFKFLRSQIIGEAREVEVVGSTIEGSVNVDIESKDNSISVAKTISGNRISFNLEVNSDEWLSDIRPGGGISVTINNGVALISNIGVLSLSDGSTSASGNIHIGGANGSGLTALVRNANNAGSVEIDLRGRTNEQFGIKTLSFPKEDGSGRTEVKFFGTDDAPINLKGIKDITYTPSDVSGGSNILTITTTDNNTLAFTILNGKDGVTPEQNHTVEVITGITPSFSNGKLTLTLQKRKIKTSSIENISDASTEVTIFDINNAVDVVTDVKYDTSTLILSQAKIPIISVGDTTSETAPTNGTVFTATEHETDI